MIAKLCSSCRKAKNYMVCCVSLRLKLYSFIGMVMSLRCGIMIRQYFRKPVFPLLIRRRYKIIRHQLRKVKQKSNFYSLQGFFSKKIVVTPVCPCTFQLTIPIQVMDSTKCQLFSSVYEVLATQYLQPREGGAATK